MNIEIGMTAVLSMSVMFWIRIRNICVTPQIAESPRMARRTIGCLHVAAKLRLEERSFKESCVAPTRMKNAARVESALSPR